MSWTPDPNAFLAELESVPAILRELAASFADDPWRGVELDRRIVCIGMGSSRFAARRAADASEELLAGRDAWLPDAAGVLGETGPRFLIAPQERISSALQGALMFREGPRQQADACETGDWLHVDVYLTQPMSYRAVLFAGSRFDVDVARWINDRGGRVLAVGARPDADVEVRYRGDDDVDVALLTEVLVPELLTAEAWDRQA
jgi:hypothetical protein